MTAFGESLENGIGDPQLAQGERIIVFGPVPVPPGLCKLLAPLLVLLQKPMQSAMRTPELARDGHLADCFELLREELFEVLRNGICGKWPVYRHSRSFPDMAAETPVEPDPAVLARATRAGLRHSRDLFTGLLLSPISVRRCGNAVLSKELLKPDITDADLCRKIA